MIRKMNHQNIKLSWTELIKAFLVIVPIIVGTVTFMNYTVVDALKLNIQTLEKQIDQREKINSLDSVVQSLRNILNEQDNLITNRNVPNSEYKETRSDKISSRLVQQIKDKIRKGEDILPLKFYENANLEVFLNWRDNTQVLIQDVDTALGTDYGKDFQTLTQYNFSNCNLIPNKINDGIAVLNLIINRMDNNL